MAEAKAMIPFFGCIVAAIVMVWAAFLTAEWLADHKGGKR